MLHLWSTWLLVVYIVIKGNRVTSSEALLNRCSCTHEHTCALFVLVSTHEHACAFFVLVSTHEHACACILCSCFYAWTWVCILCSCFCIKLQHSCKVLLCDHSFSVITHEMGTSCNQNYSEIIFYHHQIVVWMPLRSYMWSETDRQPTMCWFQQFQ